MKNEPLENNIVSLHARGWSIHRLSLEFGISRGRTRRVLQRNVYKRSTGHEYHSKPGRQGSKIDTYKPIIQELLENYKNVPPTNQRIFELLKEKGYDGGITILRDYLARIRGKKAKVPITCVETLPGQRGAHDWSEYNILFSQTGKREKVTFFSFILGYSRRQYIEIVEDKTQTTLLNCLVNTFIYFDGVPKEIKSDNQKACVDHWELGRPVFNTKFLTFATHYCFKPLTITPREPKENLKIERPFYYLETNFLNARTFYDKQDLKQQLQQWLNERNDHRIHRVTGRKPIDAYHEEFPFLQPLPREHFDTSRVEYRIVNNESCIQWEHYFYVVPKEYLYETCSVRATKSELTIYSPDGKEIKRYPLAEKGRTDRYVGSDNTFKGKPVLQAKEVIQRLEAFGPVMEGYIKEIKIHKSNYLHHLRHVLMLKINYRTDDIIIAVRRALKYKVYESGAIENFLSVNATKKNEIKLMPKTSEENEK